MTYRNARCEVDLAQFRRNLDVLGRTAETKVLQVVKADAYGHGLLPVAAEAQAWGVDMLGVATIGEAQALLDGGIITPILIICALDSQEIEYCVAHGVHFLAWRIDQFETAMAAADHYGRPALIHLEIDTGMSRSGVYPQDAMSLVEQLTPAMRSSVVGMATHFFLADDEVLDTAETQLQEFLDVAQAARALGMRPMLHAANSPGAVRMHDAALDMVRLGVVSYGIAPSEFVPTPAGVAPILSWKATVTNIKDVPKGRGVSYGWEFVADRDIRVATIGVGYADGFRRKPAAVNTVLMDGHETRVIGRVCMDQCVVEVPEGVDCALGNEVVLIGRSGASEISADLIAERWGTNSYDVLSGIRGRVPRHYIGGT